MHRPIIEVKPAYAADWEHCGFLLVYSSIGNRPAIVELFQSLAFMAGKGI